MKWLASREREGQCWLDRAAAGQPLAAGALNPRPKWGFGPRPVEERAGAARP
jgi:hypothetical protein